ncbi:MAG: ParB/RepB/Spo0J family partition protein [Peptoniphilus sp.]|nr:ParB/RepB/Spo0J family partition protein [Peptoniphilus sp.]MDD7363548.1 ParB/RepB/Spo0J family partition protein [Bacillota bacterium]MDY6044749.1 ParB/RepB/Spo0J family partition protein [Peptoniphilus sp.]
MEKKRGLGRGLDNFFGTQPLKDEPTDTLSVDRIKRNPKQPRKYFSDESLDELAESIRKVGVLQPLLVKKEEDDYLLIAGERRLRAARRAGLKEVPVRMIDASDEEVDQISLIENIQREDLNPIEEAEGYETLKKKYKYTQDNIAELVGKSRPYVANSMRLLKLEPVVQDMMKKGQLSISQGKLLLSIKDGNEQIAHAKRMIKEGETIEESAKSTRSKTNNKARASYYSDLEDKLMDRLGTKTQVKGSLKKGKVIIDYHSKEDLMRIYDLIMGGEFLD